MIRNLTSSIKSTQKYLYILLIFLNLVLAVHAISTAYSWKDKVFPGFLLYNPTVVSDIALRSFAQYQGFDLKTYDKIVKVDDVDINNATQVYDIVSSSPSGTFFSYSILRDKQIIEVEIPSSLFSSSDLLKIVGVEFFVGFVFLFLGVLVYFLKPDLFISKIFLLVSICLSIWFFQ